MGIIRVAGEAFDADQTEILCDDCGLDQYHCVCELVPDDDDEGEANEPDEDDLVEFTPRSNWGLGTVTDHGGGHSSVWC